MDKAVIDYRKIADAVDYYVDLGYKYIEVPWIVSKSTANITKPEWCRNFETFLGTLVASGEQSFLEIRTHLHGKYVCVTPCFRDENPVTELHRNYFMKVELIHVEPDNWESMLQMREDATCFFRRYSYNIKYSIQAPNEMDIEINGIEVGSYGFREYNGFKWVYGTGCAEPRLSQAIGS